MVLDHTGQVVPMGTPMGSLDVTEVHLQPIQGGMPVLQHHETDLARNEYLLQKANRGDEVLGGVGKDPAQDSEKNVPVTLSDIAR